MNFMTKRPALGGLCTTISHHLTFPFTLQLYMNIVPGNVYNVVALSKRHDTTRQMHGMK